MPITSRNRNQFCYCSFWGTWSRVLRPLVFETRESPCVMQVEVDLTPINIRAPEAWDKVKAINIRQHNNFPDGRDLLVWDLPDKVLQLMKMYLDNDVINRLINENFLPSIDWAKYNACNNTEAPFELIRKVIPNPKRRKTIQLEQPNA